MREWQRLAGPAAMAILVLGCGMVVGVHLEAVIAVSTAIVVLVIAAVAAGIGGRHVLLARRFRRSARRCRVGGVEVGAVPGLTPLVAGLVRPRIYACPRLLDELPEGQRRAVLLHERAHRDHHDPARLVLLEAVRQCVGRIPAIADVEAAARARLEIRADRHALEFGASRPELAAAILRLADVAPATTPAFGTVTDRRLLALLEEADGPPARLGPRLWIAIAAGALAVATCTSVLSDAHPEVMWVMHCIRMACNLPG